MPAQDLLGARNMDAAVERADELIALSDALLSRFGRDIEADNGLVRCLALAGFLVSTYSEEPDLTVYRILQLDGDQNICHLFAAARRGESGSTDLRLYLEGPWEETFRRLGTGNVDLASERPMSLPRTPGQMSH